MASTAAASTSTSTTTTTTTTATPTTAGSGGGGVLTEAIVLGKTKQSNISAVTKLNLWGFDISDVSILSRMKAVEVLSLSGNRIETLKDFVHCPNLKELFLRKNRLTSLTELAYLKALPALRNLWLAENPCTQTPDYRSIVIALLPQITKLDDADITDEERERARKVNIGQLSLPSYPRRGSFTDSAVNTTAAAITATTAATTAANTTTAATAVPSATTTAAPKAVTTVPAPLTASAHNQSIPPSLGRPPSSSSSSRSQDNMTRAIMILLDELDDEHLRSIKADIDKRISAKSSAANIKQNQ